MADNSIDCELATTFLGIEMVTFLLYERLDRKSNKNAWLR